MSYEAINNITQTESQARAAAAAAEQRARQMLADAEAAGKLAVEAALRKADGELAELEKQIDLKAREYALGVSAELEKEKELLRRRAEPKIDRAADLVVERIVSG